MIHNKQITLYFFHKSWLIESRVRSFNNSPKCMIKIFIESDKFSHKAGVTKHATNRLARKLHNSAQIVTLLVCVPYVFLMKLLFYCIPLMYKNKTYIYISVG